LPAEATIKVRPLWRWLFARTWCVVALPWLVAAALLAALGYAREAETAGKLLAPTYTSALEQVKTQRARLEQFAQGASADMRLEELSHLPGVLAVASWRTTQAASWIYRTPEHDRWYRVVEEPGPPPQPVLHALSEGLPSATATVVPEEWRAHGTVLGTAMSQLRKQKDYEGRANTWHFEDKLALSGQPGYLLIALQELDGGNIRGSYVELAPDALLAKSDATLLARQFPDGHLAPLGNGVPTLETLRVRDWEPQRVHDKQGKQWLAGETVTLPGDERVYVAALAKQTSVLQHALLPAALCGGVGLVATLLLLLGHPVLWQRFIRELNSAGNEIRRLDVLRGPYYWPKTRVAELRALYGAVEEAADALNAREDLLRHSPTAIDAIARPTLLVEQELEVPATASAPAPAAQIDSAPAESTQYPTTPPAAFIQAMESLRRQLNDTRQALDTVREQHAKPGVDTAGEAALAERLRAALFAFDDPALASDTLATSLDVASSARYRINETFSTIAPEGDSAPPLPRAMLRTQHPLFFLALARARSLWIGDVLADPRTASLFLEQKPEAPTALAAVLLNDDTTLWIGLRPGGTTTWRAAEQLFAEAIAQRTAQPETPPAPEIPVSAYVAPESAHALWAQPNLPNNPDAPIFRTITDNTAVGLFTLAKDARITYVNPSAERIFARPVSELLGQPLVALAVSAEADALQGALAQVFAGSPMDERDLYFNIGDGTKALLRVYFTPLQDESGEPIGYAGTVLDVTALRAREMMLARQESVYRGIVEGAPQLLWSIDAIGCITFVNHVCAEIYGYTAEEMTGRTITMLCDEAQARHDVERLALLLGGRTCAGYRTIHRHRDGTPVPLVVVASRQLDPSGRVTGAVGLAIALSGDEEQ